MKIAVSAQLAIFFSGKDPIPFPKPAGAPIRVYLLLHFRSFPTKVPCIAVAGHRRTVPLWTGIAGRLWRLSVYI